MAIAKSTRSKRAARPSRHKTRRKGATLPDLSPTLHALWEAISMVACAHAALRYADQWGPEEVTLRTGLEALRRVHNDFDSAETQLHRLRRVQR